MWVEGKHHRTVWLEGSTVRMIDQPLLPHRFEIASLPTFRATGTAIQTMVVRGAGAIGATAGFGVAQAALAAPEHGFHDHIAQAVAFLEATRPTAQNLFYATRRVLGAIQAEGDNLAAARQAAVHTAQAIADEDAAACEAIGRHGVELVGQGCRVSTHCNAGWLAFVDWGSALAPIHRAQSEGRKPFVWVDETRPRSQGARLTAWELAQAGIAHAVVADNATGHLMQRGSVDLVLVGSDRIAANGDVANKIGTYSSAVVAAAHGIPFYVAAPSTTIDHSCAHGDDIPIEERDGDEVCHTWGWSDEGHFLRVRTTPVGTQAHNPAFDVTPAELIAGIVTEQGIVPATPEGIAGLRTGSR
jgi:methylthioribose-1-phosphate isomerase